MVIGVIVALIIGLAAGYLIKPGAKTETSSTAMTNTSSMNMDSTMAPSSNTKAADLRVALSGLYMEHVHLAAAAVRAGFDGRTKDFDAAAKTLDNNSVAIAKAVGSVYGADADTQFLAIWRSHIGFFVDYTVAAKKGDKAGMDKAVENLMGYVASVSHFLAVANPNLPEATVKDLVTQHVLQLKGAVDAYGAGDVAKSYALQEEAAMHMGMIATTIAGAIVKQYPDKFR